MDHLQAIVLRLTLVNIHLLPKRCVAALSIVLWASLAAPNAVWGAAFKWKDASGQTHYGEKPPADATEIQQIDLYQCDTPQCKAEEAQRRADQLEIQRQTEEWLVKRAEIKQQLIQPRARQPVYIPIYVPAVTPWLYTPVVSHLGRSKYLSHGRFGRHAARGHISHGGHGLHGPGHGSHGNHLSSDGSPTPKTFGFP